MIQTKRSIFDFTKEHWNSYVPKNHPFLRYEFYQALEESQCIGEKSGWIPYFLYNDEAILPLYLKSHSYGEYIFDWSWAQAYERVGLDYYPKLTAALPHSPVSGAKFISTKEFAIAPFLEKISELTQELGVSSTHFLFTEEDESRKLLSSGFKERHSIQYHWHNQDYRDFDHWLSVLKKNKRKNFKKERALIKEQGITIKIKEGNEIDVVDAQFMAKLYFTTVEKKWSNAYLNQEFFLRWFELLKSQMLFITASIDDGPIAAAIHLKSDDTLYGRYWGSLIDIPGLHFELCYYQAIEYGIAHKFNRIEAGAQGEHKLLRGFRPTIIKSFHKIEHPNFADAIAQFLLQEKTQIDLALVEMNKYLPYKNGEPS